MNQDRKITVEDLLRLKRAERPPAEFWAKFDAEIRAKQLSAIVSRRPWWVGLIRGFSGVRRMQLPLGAAAAVALTWAGLHYAGSRPVTVQVLPAAVTVTRAPEATAAVPAPQPVKLSIAVHEVVESSPRDLAAAEKPVVAATSSHLVQAPAALSAEATSASPFADGIAVTLADYRSMTVDVARTPTFGSDREFEPSIAPSHPQVSDPLAHVDPAEERRERLLAPALGPRQITGDWMKQRASTEVRMYESMDDHTSSDRSLVGFRF
jgi:hypothetical protein